MTLALDGLLALLIAAVAAGAVLGRDLATSIVFFIVYGLMLAIAWVRLDAIDVALAEAAIGAGLTGILLIGAAARLGPAEAADRGRSMLVPAGLALVCLAAVAALWTLIVAALGDGAGLQRLVERNLAATGLGNPVTAVLLNFRGYDTLLETVVLVLALVAVWSLTPERFWGGAPGLEQHARPDGVLAQFGRILPAVGLIVGVHLLWAGSDAPGGAFQAGTVLAAVWLLVAMAGLTDAPAVSDVRLRLVVVAGPVLFVLFGAAGALSGTFLAYPAGASKIFVLAIEAGLTASIAAILAMLVLGVPRRAR